MWGFYMSVCTYDNPSSMMRECWANKKLQAAYSCVLYAQEWKLPGYLYHMGANIGDWKTNQLIGDPTALDTDNYNSYLNFSNSIK